MAFKSGLLVGFGAGYLLGARAGRERYDQIHGWWNQMTGSPAVQPVTQRTQEMAGEAVQEPAGHEVPAGEFSGSADSGTDPWRGNEVPDTPQGQLP